VQDLSRPFQGYPQQVTHFSRRTFLSVAAAGLTRAETAPVAKTTGGPLRGVTGPGGLAIFKGIPYARAGRFRPPAPVRPWIPVRDAISAGPIAPQNDDGTGIAALPQSEDCLSLNIWSPALDHARRPVLFYIHGGAFENGSGRSSALDGSMLARNENVVVVTINYRLGVFGFPPFEVYPGVPRNLGLLDQIAALEWVRDNIAGFGGDRGNVTIFGLSAGGWSTVSLMVLPQARNLFHRAAPESPAYQYAADEEHQAINSREFLKALGTLRAADAAARPVSDLLRAQQATVDAHHASLLAEPWHEMRGFPFIPVQDGITLKDDPLHLMQQGASAPVPMLAGGAAAEIAACPFRMAVKWLAALHEKDRLLQALERATTPALAHQIYNGYLAARPGATEAQIGGYLRSDWQYRVPMLRSAEAHARRNPVWVYDFAYPAPSPNIGIATHAFDTAFWFGNIGGSALSAFFFGRAPNDAEMALSREMQRDLATFARSGQANWARYDTKSRWTKSYDLPKTSIVADPRGSERRLWDRARL
jgi:para-nitrobenzyl esterase